MGVMVPEAEGESNGEVHLCRRLVEQVQYHDAEFHAHTCPPVVAEASESTGNLPGDSVVIQGADPHPRSTDPDEKMEHEPRTRPEIANGIDERRLEITVSRSRVTD